MAKSATKTHCRLCYGKTDECFSVTLLGRHRVALHECRVCGSLQTDQPYWLDEAYADARPITDTGIVQRTLETSILCSYLLNFFSLSSTHQCVDFGGANGLFSRMMRDRGYNFFSYDRYADPFYVPHHGAIEHGIERAVVVTCFEVLEHLPEPAKNLQEIFAYEPDIIIASTDTYHGQGATWPYLSLENGQHVFFYSTLALGQVAEAYGYGLISTGYFHIFCRNQPRTLSYEWDTVRELGRMLLEPDMRRKTLVHFLEAMNSPYRHVLSDHGDIVSKIRTDTVCEPPKLVPGHGIPRGFQVARGVVERRPIIIEGSFFQIYEKSGIARVWKEILHRWAGTPFGDRIIFLDRAGTAPRINGIRRVLTEPYVPILSSERQLVQRYCDHFNAGAFISTYYASTETTPSVMLVYDMIPERLTNQFNYQASVWQEKNQLMRIAKRFVCISANTRKDLLELRPHINPDVATVGLLGVSEVFSPQEPDRVQAELARHTIDRPYLLFIGGRTSYKNVECLVEGWQGLPEGGRPLVVFVGGGPLPHNLKAAFGEDWRSVDVDDRDLAALYSDALALVFPSFYEGFGLPLLEAMACGCPVICSKASSFPEVAGNAALYISPFDPISLTAAIMRVQQPAIRRRMIDAGFLQAAKFSWDTIADALRIALETVADAPQAQ